MVQGLGDMGLSLAFAAVGSALGTGIAGMAAIGAWKRAFAQNKLAPFILIAFVGAPLSQTIYGFILKNQIRAVNLPPESYVFQILLGAAAYRRMFLPVTERDLRVRIPSVPPNF